MAGEGLGQCQLGNAGIANGDDPDLRESNEANAS
jgi:hypothetical protein